MAQLNVKLSPEQIEALRKYADRRRTPVAWLIRDYIDYLLRGGTPVTVIDDELASHEMAQLAQHGGAFDWLAGEPELYAPTDGEPV